MRESHRILGCTGRGYQPGGSAPPLYRQLPAWPHGAAAEYRHAVLFLASTSVASITGGYECVRRDGDVLMKGVCNLGRSS